MVHDSWPFFEIKGVKTCLSWRPFPVKPADRLWRFVWYRSGFGEHCSQGSFPERPFSCFSCFFLHENAWFLGWNDVCFSFKSWSGFGVDLFLIHLDEMIIDDNDIGSYFVYIYIHSTIHCMYFSHIFSLLDDGDIGTSSIPPSFGLAPWTRRNALERWWSLFASKELLWRSPQPSTAFLVPKFSWSSQTWMIWMFVLLFVPGDWCENSSTMKIPCRPLSPNDTDF